MTHSSLKNQLLAACLQKVEANLSEIEQALQSAREAANDSTKSTAGDKYETTRAMMHLEQEKLSSQLAEARQMKGMLLQIEPEKPHSKVETGSLVVTTSGRYFLSVGLGKIEVDGNVFFVISPASPIGQLLGGKSAGDTFSFRNTVSEVISVE